MNTGRNDPCPCGSGKKYKKCCLVSVESSRVASEKARAAADAHLAKDEFEADLALGEERVKDADEAAMRQFHDGKRSKLMSATSLALMASLAGATPWRR